MRYFTGNGRTRTRTTRSSDGAETPAVFPVGFEAVGETLVAEECPLAACDAVGREMAADGASVQEALSGLRQTYVTVRRHDPDFEAVQALLGAWSEVTLSVVNHISCEDPMTGLASLAHVRSSLSALFRGHAHAGAEHPRETHALVVVDLPGDPRGTGGDDRGGRGGAATVDPLGRALRMARLADAARTVFGGPEVIGRLTGNRIAVLVTRDPRLGVRVRLLRRLVEGMDLSGRLPRVWIEGLGADDTACGLMLDELARA